MKRLFLLPVLLLCLTFVLQAGNDKGNDLQKKSELKEPYGYIPSSTSFPMPFAELTQSVATPAISTGYFFYDTEQNPLDSKKIKDIWTPKDKSVPDTTYEPPLWKRILAGPRIVPKVFWENNPYGKYFFRNPADMLNKDIFNPASGAIDSIKNAIAGPMPLGIKGGFYFNGLRYDSFYVSSNGIIGLTNRRYIYDESGNRVIPTGAANCYDVYSMDWFVGGTRTRSGTGLTDQAYDDFGYNSSILGRNPDVYYPDPASDPFYTATSGLRSTGKTDLSTFTTAGWSTTNCKPALIAPFWGNISLSQYNKDARVKEDYGKVYFKTTKSGDSLIIAFYNVTFRGTVKDVPAGTYTFAENARNNNMKGYVEWDAKVVLDKRDSSITFNYSRLSGTSLNQRNCGDVIRANTTAGVLGWARHINYNTKNIAQQVQPSAYSYPWSQEYMQYTHYFSNNQDINNKYPINGTSVKFKQWKNTLRAINILYRIRNSKQPGPDYNYDFLPDPVKSIDFEMLAGQSLIGAIQPMGVVQNLTNDIQGPNGVNFVAQDLEFKALFVITNVITDRIVYARDIPVSKLCLGLDANWTDCANDLITRVRLVKAIATDAVLKYKVTSKYTGAEFTAAKFTGIPPYKFVEVTYPPFEPNEFIDNQIGRMHCKLIARPVNIAGQPIGDQWPFDDTLSIRLFVIRRLTTFNDDVSEFNIESNTGFTIPSVLKWVAIDAYATDGDVVSMHPLPPRGEFKRSIPGEEIGNMPANAQGLLSPVILLNRTIKVYGQEIEAEPVKANYKTEFNAASSLGGDELRSFPIDLRERFGAVLSFSLQRGLRLNPGYSQDYYRGWGDKNLQGPESKIYVNTWPFNAPRVAGIGGSADMLCLEFAKPPVDGLNGICNITEADWRYLPQRKGSKTAAATDMPVLTLYGGGGYLRGFLKEDPDSVLKYPDLSKFYFNACDEIDYYKYFLYDEGLDWEYKKFAVQIPDTFISSKNNGAQNFRFRFKVLATNHTKTQFVPDDYDDFLLDNINILFKDTLADLECGSVRIDWPYTLVPASQATNIPVMVKVANNTVISSKSFGVKVRIYRDGDFDKGALTSYTRDGEKIKPLYCRVENIPNLQPGTEIEVRMPAWNARKSQIDPLGKYTIVANIVQDTLDLLPNNDTTFFDAELRFGDAFAFDPVENPTNDVDKEVIIPGRGLNLPGSSYEWGVGWPAISDEDRIGAGIITNSWSGRMATRFDLANTDTIKGFQVYFTSLNASPDFIEFAVIRGNSSLPTEKIITATKMFAKRGDVGNGKRVFNKYITYTLETPVELPSDVYWVAITQMATDGMNLGGSRARSALKVSNFFQHPITGQYAVSGTSLYLDKNFRLKKDDRYVNQNFFAYVNSYPGDSWAQFTPTTGIIAYAHTDHQGLSLVDKSTNTYVNGTWIPMLRPFFGERAYGTDKDGYEECPDDWIPVEMLGFNGNVRQNGIELIWQTATETNNYGFEVQRRNLGNDEWNLLGFVSGAGTSVTNKYYNYLDKNVEPSSTYQYRLRQIDNDGTVSCKSTDIVTITYDNIGDLTLNQNTPNPFNHLTDISFYLPTSALTKLEIVDLLGNTVKVLNNTNLNAGKHNYRWDSKDQFGNDVSNGTYIYRLVVGEQVRTAKMTLAR